MYLKFLTCIFFAINCLNAFSSIVVPVADTLKDRQELYNGSIWIDYYSLVKGDQFLFTREFLPGTVVMRGKSYRVSLRYDIFEDELQTPAGRFGILRINKAMIDSFSLFFNDSRYLFVPLSNDDDQRTRDFYNVLYRGKASLYVSHRKKIKKQTGNGENAQFYQVTRFYVARGDTIHPVRNKKEFFEILDDKETEMKAYIRRNRLKLSLRNPGTFVPLISYYNSLITGK